MHVQFAEPVFVTIQHLCFLLYNNLHCQSGLLLLCGQQPQFAASSAYCVVKELVMTERTYKKDLEIIAVVCTQSSLYCHYSYSYNNSTHLTAL